MLKLIARQHPVNIARSVVLTCVLVPLMLVVPPRDWLACFVVVVAVDLAVFTAAWFTIPSLRERR